MILDIIAMASGLIIIGMPIWSFIKWGSKNSQEQAVYLTTASKEEIAEYNRVNFIVLLLFLVMFVLINQT